MSAIESMNVSDRSRQFLEFGQNKAVPNYVIQIPDVTLLHIFMINLINSSQPSIRVNP